MRTRRELLAEIRLLEERRRWGLPERFFQRYRAEDLRAEALRLETELNDGNDTITLQAIALLNTDADFAVAAREELSPLVLEWRFELESLRAQLAEVEEARNEQREQAYADYLTANRITLPSR